ncbi:DNA polymerase III subunit delta [Gorillibacterium timonense]|uniref:DNA polymerase III subunit delta n=1 Tax=Gorillibacterium timonense TaxID=1689269 RepID=UPI00071CBD81|nr:DNA polymerase III subunit delta [Gorillibacterium timonense]
MADVSPVLVCYGTEKFLREEFLNRQIDQTIDPELRDFALIRYDLAETPLDAVLEEAETIPFMAERKIVIAANAIFLTGAKDPSKVEHRTDLLLAYLGAPAPHTQLIFTVDAEKLDERKKLVKALKEKKLVKAFTPLSAEELPGWVERRAQKRGIGFERPALDRFVLYTGGQLQAMDSELAKLELFAGSDSMITLETVEMLVPRSVEQNVFLLMEDIVSRRLDKAMDQLHELLKQKEEPIKLVMLMARQFRLILQVKDLYAQGYSQQQTAAHIGSHPYPVKLAAEQGRAYNTEQLKGILTEIADLDYAMKTGRTDKVLGLELLLLKLAA